MDYSKYASNGSTIFNFSLSKIFLNELSYLHVRITDKKFYRQLRMKRRDIVDTRANNHFRITTHTMTHLVWNEILNCLHSAIVYFEDFWHLNLSSSTNSATSTSSIINPQPAVPAAPVAPTTTATAATAYRYRYTYRPAAFISLLFK